jgi:hypothetical protein
MDEVNACMAANADQEELVDQPEIDRKITRVSGLERNEFLEEDEHAQAEDQIGDNGAVPELLGRPFVSWNAGIVQRGSGRKIQRFKAELHSLIQGSNSAKDGKFENLILLRHAGVRRRAR